MSKNRVYVDPRYAEGNERRKNTRQRIADESGFLYGAHNQGLLGTDTDFDDYLKSAPIDKDIYPNIDENGNIIRSSEPDDTSIFDGFKTRNEHSSLTDAWRMTFEKGYQSRYLAKANELQEINDSLDDVQEAQDYKNKLEELYDLEAEMYRAINSGADERTVFSFQTRLNLGYKELDDLEKDIKDRWKKSDVFLDLFTNTAAYDDPRYTDNLTRAAVDLYNFGPTGNANYNGNVINDIFQGTKRLFDTFGNMAGGVVSAFRGTGEQLVGSDKHSYLKRALKNSPDDTQTFDHLFNSYKQHTGETKNHIRLLQSKVDKLREGLERDKAAKEADLKSTLDTYKNGNWLFDPKKIDPVYRKMQEEDDRGILKTIVDPSQWLYAVPEIGSSFSDFVDFTGLLMLNGGAELAASRLATTAVMRNPFAKLAYETAVVGGGLYFSNEMRRMETNAEATDAYSNRIINEAEKRGIDLNEILANTNEHLNAIGISTDGLNTLEQLQLALAYNAPTGNKDFDKLKKEARKGIAKVINENNALSFVDYLLTLPFMSYSRGVIGRFGGGVFGRQQLTPRLEQMAESMAVAARKTSNSIIDRAIDKAAGKVASNLATKMAIARTSKYIKNKAGMFGLVGLTEGVEEGQQQLLLNRFARGEYDGYDRYQSSFDIPSVFEDAGLAFDSLLAYWGLNPSDPDNGDPELIKAMNIGAVTGMMFGLGHALTNVMPTDQDNIRNLTAQLRNDAVIRRIVAEQLAQRQDAEHVGIFFDSFSRAGVNADRLEQSLNQLKSFKGSLVTDEDIDRDIKLMNKAWYTYKNPLVKTIMDDLGIKKDSDVHKLFVQQAVAKNMKLTDTVAKGAEIEGAINDNLDHKLHAAGGSQEEAGANLYSIVQKINERYNKSVERRINDIVNWKEGDNSTAPFRHSAIRNAAERNLKERGVDYTLADIDEEARRISQTRDELKGLIESDPEGFDLNDRDAFVENYLSRMFDSSLISNAEKLLTNLKNKQEVNQFIKKLFGEDVDTEHLDSIIRYIEQERDEIIARQDENLRSINTAIDAHNKVIRRMNKQREKEGKEAIKELDHMTEKSLLKDLGEFEDQEEIDRLQMLYLMNYATEQMQRPLSDAYMFGEARPDKIIASIKPALWSELSQSQRDALIEQTRKRYEEEGRSDKFKGEATARTIYNNDVNKAVAKVKELVKKREEILKRQKDNPEAEASLADIDDLRAVNKEAAKLYISEELKRAQEARERERDEAPVTPDDVEAAEEGDKNAAKKVAGAAKLMEETEVKDEQDVEFHEKPRERKSAIVDELEDEIGSAIAGEEFDKTKKQSKKLREKEEAERKEIERAKMEELEGEELTKYMIEHPDLMVNAFDDPSNFFNDADISEAIGKYRNGEVMFYITDGEETIYFVAEYGGPEDLKGIREVLGLPELSEDELKSDRSRVFNINVVTYSNGEIRPTDKFKHIGFSMPKGWVVDDENTFGSPSNIYMSMYEEGKFSVDMFVFYGTDGFNVASIHKPGVDTGISSDPDDNLDSGAAAANVDHSGEDANIDSEENQDAGSNISVNDVDTTLSVEDEDFIPGKRPKPSDIHVENDGQVTLFVEHDPIESTVTVDPDTLEVYPTDEQSLLVDMNDAYGADYTDYVSSRNRDRRETVDKEDIAPYIESTCFYQPDNNVPMKLVHPDGHELTETKGNKRYLNGKEVMPGAEFAKKLAQIGWFYSIPKENMYYVVSLHKGNTDKTNPDGFTITLCIEDGDKVYLSSLRTPEKYVYEDEEGNEARVDGVERIKSSLRMINIDRTVYEDNLNERIEDAFDTTNPSDVDKPWGVKIGWFNRLPVDSPIKQSVILQARMRSLKKTNKPILSEKEIDHLIEKLRENRMSIIEAYCDKDPVSGVYKIPTEIRTNVHPGNADISNGSINNGAEYHSIVDKKGIDLIQKAINEQQIRMGYGLGEFSIRSAKDKFAIVNLFKGKGRYHGKGFSGKLYMIVQGPGRVDAPIQLHEETFGTQKLADGTTINLHRETDNLELGIELNAKGFGEVKSSTSAAEVLLYLMCGKLSVSELPTATQDLQKQFAKLFVHYDGTTIMEDRRTTQNGFPDFAAKQLDFDKNVFTIGEKDEKGDWHPVPYEMSEIFGNSPEQIATRRRLIYQISENMHWNTDREDMIEKFNTGILRALRSWFDAHPNADSFKLCGVDQFEFKKSDLFDLDKNGTIRRQKNITVLAWMLKNNKLTVDTQEQMFYAPFVFADGVAQAKPKDSVVEKGKPGVKSAVKKAAEDAAAAEIAASNANIESLIAGVETKLGKGFVARTEEKRKEILDSYYSTLAENGGMEDILAVDLGDKKFANIEEVKTAIHKHIDDYISRVNKTRDADKQLSMQDSDWESVDGMTKLDLKSINNGKKMPVFYVTKNGTGSTLVMSTVQDIKAESNITGAASIWRGRGKFNEARTRAWVKRTLGLGDDQMIVVDGIINSTSNGDVYGLTQICCDTLDRPFGAFTFSEEAGRGIGYHEAWHYVNLLLHNRAQRLQLYRAYVAKHPELKNAKFREIEEKMAEDFRKYGEMMNERNITNVFKKWWNRFLDFLFAYRKRDLIRRVFDSIQNGDYVGATLDQDSLEEFKRGYNNEVAKAQFSYSGVSQAELDNLGPGINDYHTFQQVGVSLANKLLEYYDVQSIEDLLEINSESFLQFMKNLQQKNQTERNARRKKIVEVVIRNSGAFKTIADRVLKQYGVTPRTTKKGKLLKDITKVVEDGDRDPVKGVNKEDTPLNIWDIESIEVSKKANVAFRAKLFLSQIPDSTYEVVETQVGGKTKYSKKPVVKTDEILGATVYVPYGQAWNKVLNALWQAESFGKKVNGKYARNSIMGMVERRKDAEPFFNQLYLRLLLAEGDIQLESQIFCTVASSKNQIATLELSDKKLSRAGKDALDEIVKDDPELEEYVKSRDAGSTADRMRVWDMFDDNNLRAKRNLPRVWSKSAVASGMIKYNKDKAVVDESYANHLYQLVENSKDKEDKALVQMIEEFDKKLLRYRNDESKKAYLNGKNDELFDKLKEALNWMGIPFDNESLNYYIQDHLENPSQLANPLYKYEAMRSIIYDASTPGGLRFFVRQIKLAADKKRDYFLSFNKKTKRPIDQLFTGYDDNSEIVRMANAYNAMNPSTSDFSVVGPDGDMIYPISQNNFMSDAIRWLNNSSGEKAMELTQDPYARHSVILDIAKNMEYESLSIDDMFKLDTFVGLKDTRVKRGKDYFGITPMEDYIAKMFMLFQDRLVLPTMADKKTWYAIKFGDNVTRKAHVTPHEVMRYSDRSYSGDVIDIFAGYFKDEIAALKQYYSRDNIKYLIEHPGELRENFHGDVKNGRMDFSGNGGKFRYFYDVYKINGMNLNEMLQFEYNRQRAIESGEYKSKHGIAWLYEDENELDGFELIRKFLNEVENRYFGEPDEQKMFNPRETLEEDISTYLNGIVDSELSELSKPGSINMVDRMEDGRFKARAIPYQILDWYSNQYYEKGYSDYKESPYSGDDNINADLTLSAITNNVLGSMMSVIEMEKVFSGDPAFYKWKYKEKKGTKERITRTVSANVQFEDGTVHKFTTDVDILAEKHTDKIKRLGAVLSPGENLNIELSDQILQQHPELRGTKYTNLNISDAIATSQFVEEITGIFERSALVDALRNTEKYKGKYTEKELEELYSDEEKAESILNNIKKEDKDLYQSIKNSAQESVNPYTKINVSDAQVIIRPALYRKIRIALGEWSFIEDADGYSDEAAYEILENDSTWMRDPEKAALVSKLQLKPLKMTYFMNDPKDMSYDSELNPIISNLPVYNKMAIFPLFKYAASSRTGKQLYDRMNMEGNELDMITFESAVKVGGHKNKYSPFKKKTTDISSLDETLNRRSATYLSKNDEDYGTPTSRDPEEGELLLDVQVQDLSGLRLQLNTDAHHNDMRAIGTQMFKIAFSNIVEDAMYGGRTGHEIRADVMSCINALTKIGVFNLRDEFYDSRISKEGAAEYKLNRHKVHNFIKRIVENNGLGAAAEEIIGNGGVVASLTSRRVFENSVSATVNGEVIDINTKGGSAVQQSIFGFTGYGKKTVASEETVDWTKLRDEQDFPVLNGGRELKWFRKDGNMEVILSMNFFKSVIPKEEQTTYEHMRDWLFEHNIIGTNAKPFGVGYRIPTQGMSSMFSFVVADVLPQQSGDLIIVPKEFTAQTGSDFDVDKIYMAFMSYTNGEFDSIPDHVFNAIMNSKNPFLSLHDVFGDKDLDVMKDPDNWDENRQKLRVQHWHNAIANRLLGNYITIISDPKNFSDARASIDTITNKVGDVLLPLVRETFEDYRSGGYELLPSFLSNTKREFKTGKDGISPFALHITNMAMTQFTNMCMDYGDNEFGFGNLDEILGKDNIRISAWLSAMVNAHVDVAKDPYVFAINVNKATYNHVCFLLRAGMGLSTFTFMSQPILKEYAQLVMDSGGFYGQNVDGKTPKSNVYTGRRQKIYKLMLDKAKKEAAEAIDNKRGIKNNAEYVELLEKFTNLVSEDSNDVNWKEAFDEEAAKAALIDKDSASAKVFQLLAIKSFSKILRYADELSRLVHLSQIDTKKFGNNIALQINFENSMNLFKYGNHQVNWFINNEEGRLYMKDNPKDKSYAARKYFGSLYLDDKFSNAKNFTRAILGRETYMATNEFDSTFRSLMQLLNGTVPVERTYMSNGVLLTSPMHLYGEVKDEDFINSMAQAIDNIMRYRVLMHNGIGILNRLRREIDAGSYSGPIDFTFGGDPQIIASEIERLFNGLPESEDEYSKNSVFKNLADLILKIRNNGFAEEYEGLTDPTTGELNNDFLKFLLPQLPNSANEVGRMLLYKNAMAMDPDEKPTLVSAFDQLLRHPNKDVRRIARDVAIFAYYSTYDVSTLNSFFDLVPPYYRKLYDLALKMGIRSSDDQLANMVSGDDSLGIESDIADIIARNYWYDDNIVPVYYEHRIGKVSDNWTELRTHRGRSSGRSKFSGAIITSYADNPYIKVVKGDDVMLYKNVGLVTRKAISEKDKSPKNRLSIYMAVPKLGYHNGNIHHYEFSGNEHIPSIFKKQNKISGKFEQEQLEKDIATLVPSSSKKYIYEVVYDNHMPYVDSKMFFTDNSRNGIDYMNDSGNLRFVAANDKAKEKAKKRSTVVVDINNEENEKLSNRIGVQFKDSTKSIVDAIIEKIGDNESPTLYFSNSDIDVKVSKQDIKEYTDEMVAIQEAFIREASAEGISEPHIKEELEQYKKDNKDVFIEGAKRRKLNQKMFDILSNVIIEGRGKFKVRAVYADGNTGLGAATANAIMLTSGEFETPDAGGQMFIDDKFRLLRNNDEFQLIKEQFSEPDNTFVPAEWLQQLIIAIRDFVEAAEDVTADIQRLSDSIAQLTTETVEEANKELKGEAKPEVEEKEESIQILEESKKDEPGNLDVDQEAAPIDMGSMFGRPKKKYHMEC